MTLEDALVEVYSTTDEQDDLMPYASQSGTILDLASAGALRLRHAFETASAVIASWRFPNGYRVRFRVLEDEVYLKMSPLSGTFVSASPAATDVEFESVAQAYDLVGSALRVVDPVTLSVVLETFVIERNTDGSFEIAEAIPLGYSGLRYILNTPSLEFSSTPNGFNTFRTRHKPIEWISFYDTTSGASLARGGAFDTFAETRHSVAAPSAFSKVGNRILFDSAVPETIMLVRYLRNPVAGIAADDELCDLPEAFHDALVQWTRHWAFSRGGDVLAAREAWAKLNQLMAILRTQFDFETDYAESRLEISRY